MSTATQNMVHCFNKGCGKIFDLNNNTDDSCQFHPGNPVFHDALKGWSCCNKKSTDFTTFLSIPGCTKATHSNVKPVEPEKPKEEQSKKDEVIVYEAPKMPELTPRPNEDVDPVELRRTVAPSLVAALEKLTETLKTTSLGIFKLIS
jgi:cysteine/histidine-rich domain-containing protein 1